MRRLSVILLLTGLWLFSGIQAAENSPVPKPVQFSSQWLLNRANQFVRHYYGKNQPATLKVETVSNLKAWKPGFGIDSVGIAYKGRGLPRGYTILIFQAYRKGQIVRTLNFAVNVRTFDNVLVAQTSLKTGITVKPETVRKAFRETTRLRGKPLVNPEQLATLRTRRPVSAGAVLTDRDFRTPYLIRRGEAATLIYRNGSVKVKLRVRADQNGSKGDRIWFTNFDSHKRLRGEVSGRGIAVLTN